MIFEQLRDVGDGRIAEMDAAGIDMQVLSLNAPGVEHADVAEQVVIAQQSNDFLADVVKKNPTRFAAFASLPIATDEQAADELDRRVRQQGFKGALINGHTRGRYLDDKFFWPILECAEALNVPIYLHPTVPPKSVVDSLYGGLSPTVSGVFAAAGRGWHIETAIHLIRMILGGVFDRYPKLLVVVGHLGEGVPFMLQRLNKNLPVELIKPARLAGISMSTPRLRVSISRQRFSIYCWRSESRGSCSRPTIRTDRWRKRANFSTTFPSAPRTGSASRTAMRSSFSSCKPATKGSSSGSLWRIHPSCVVASARL
jgi:predicted TIM-barrel fold metal-dependent hydrolase